MNPNLSSLWQVPQSQKSKISLTKESASIAIRPAIPSDARSLADILTCNFHHYSGLLGWVTPIFRLGVYEDLQHRLASPKDHNICFVACLSSASDSAIVGMAELSIRYLESLAIAPTKAPYISNLAVNLQYRRQGIAQRLLTRCETQVRYWNYASVSLHVLENNDAAKMLYFRRGYTVQHQEHHLGSWLLRQPQRLFLQKDLSR